MSTVDVLKLRGLVDAGYLTMHTHPTIDLAIWNYTPKCQFERYWTPETLMCRGLITTPTGEIVARPFPKFFNLGEHQGDLPLEPFTVTAKMDGSLGILYWMGEGEPRIATRGSFTSDQAVRATHMLQTKYFSIIPWLQQVAHLYTFLFEIIYPENRIVVDYGKMEDLVLLAIIHKETGNEYNLQNLPASYPIPVVKHYDGIKDIAQLQAIQEDNAEGFVIRFESGLRLKLKFTEYVRLHKLLTQINARTIWDLMRNDQPFDELLERVPDEFYHWVKSTKKDLSERYNAIEGEAEAYYIITKDLSSRKEQASIITQSPYPGVTFAMLDNKPYAEAIWRMLRPSAEKPFREDRDG